MIHQRYFFTIVIFMLVLFSALLYAQPATTQQLHFSDSPEHIVTISNTHLKLSFSSKGGQLKNAWIRTTNWVTTYTYTKKQNGTIRSNKHITAKADWVQIVNYTQFAEQLQMKGDRIVLEAPLAAVDWSYSSYLAFNLGDYSLHKKNADTIELTYTLKKGEFNAPISGITLKKTISLVPDSYLFTLDYELINNYGNLNTLKSTDRLPSLQVRWAPYLGSSFTQSRAQRRFSMMTGAVMGGIQRKDFKQFGGLKQWNMAQFKKKNETHWNNELYGYALTENQYIAMADRYFMVAITRGSETGSTAGWFVSRVVKEKAGMLGKQPILSRYAIGVETRIHESLPKNTAQHFNYTIYLGPKHRHLIKQEIKKNNEYAPFYNRLIFATGFNRALGVIPIFLLNCLRSLYAVFPNYGVAILILTLLLKVVLYPLSATQMKSMKRMQLIQPKTTAIREQYKDDPQKMNTEMMALYKKYGVNPMSGCFPMLLQMPILIGFYNVLGKAFELRGAPFAFWITDLSVSDTVAQLTIPFLNTPFNVNILPILMGVLMFIQQKITPQQQPAASSESNEMAQQQQKMLKFMPFFFLLILWNLPSGLVLYWTFQNLLSIGQQLIVNNAPEESLEQIERAQKGKRSAWKKRIDELQKSRQRRMT